MSEQVIRPEGIPSEEAFGFFTISMRGYFSTQHLWSAEHYTGLAAELEAGHTGEARFSIRHRSYVLSAVGEAVAFLEAFINELFQDAADATEPKPVPGAHVGLRGLSDDVVQLMAAYWNSTDEGERVRTLDKYDTARLFAGCQRQDRGRLADQDVPRVIALRNWSVHYRPQSYSHDEPDLRAKVEDARVRITENALMAGADNPWSTDKALGAGCARWAVDTVRAFVDEFVAAMGCRADYSDLSMYDEQL
jgi:hypothetical protein